MRLTTLEVERLLPDFEGLVCETARMLAAGEGAYVTDRPVEEEPEDIAQILRIKVLKALRSYDSDRVKRKKGESSRDSIRRYTFMCVRDQAKDVLKRRRLDHSYIEDWDNSASHTYGSSRQDRLHNRYLSEQHDQAYREIEDEFPDLPDTLTVRERDVMVLMFADHKQAEIAGLLSISKRDVESAARALRAKLAGWKDQHDRTRRPKVAA